MAADEGAFGAYYPQGYNPDIADLEFRGRGGTPTAGVIPSGAAGVLPQVSRQADATLTDIDKLMADAKANGARQSPIGWVLGELMAKLAPSVTGSAARIAQAPIDYVQGRDVDLRASDGLLALPAAGPLAKKIAGGIPGLAVAPETAATVGTGLGAYAIGHGVAGEANAAGEGGNVAMPARMDKAQFLSEHAKFEPKPSAPPDIAVALTEAEGRAKQDPKYDQMGPKGRAAMVETYRTRAESAHAKQLLNLGQQQATWATGADKAFGDAVKGWDAQEAKFNDQGFFDRNPELRGPVMGAGYALPAVLGAGTAIAKNNQGNRFVDQALANAGKDLNAVALAESQAAKWAAPPSLGDRAKNFGTALAASGGPFEARGFGDTMDATFAPEGSGAKRRAQEHFADPIKYIMDGLPQILSGGALYGIGAKAGSLASGNPKNEIAGMLDPGRAARVTGIAEREAAGIRAQIELESARRQLAAMEAGPVTTASAATGAPATASQAGLSASVDKAAANVAPKVSAGVSRIETAMTDHYAANPGQPLRRSDIAQMTGTDKGNTSRYVDGLIATGRAKEVPGANAREKYIVLVEQPKADSGLGAFTKRGD